MPRHSGQVTSRKLASRDSFAACKIPEHWSTIVNALGEGSLANRPSLACGGAQDAAGSSTCSGFLGC